MKIERQTSIHENSPKSSNRESVHVQTRPNTLKWSLLLWIIIINKQINTSCIP